MDPVTADEPADLAGIAYGLSVTRCLRMRPAGQPSAALGTITRP